MNTDILFQKIKNPSLFLQSDISILKDLTLKYPFSQLYPILYLQTLALHKDLHFDEELKNYAFKITDRVKLYDLIYSFETNSNSLEINDFTQSKVEDSVETNAVIEEIEEVKIEPFVEISPESEVVSSITAIEIKVEAELIEEKEEIVLTKTELRNNDILEQEILSNIISSSYSLEMEEKKPILADELSSVSSDKTNPDDKSNVKSDSEIINEEVKIEIISKIDISSERSFSSWLTISDEKITGELIEEKDLKINQEIKSESSKLESESLKVEKDKIIEEFIKAEPQISKPKTEFYSAPKKAKESISDEKLIYSDTLANIFALQGNFPKAIKAFEQLSLSSPEKAVFYQEKIKELKKKMNP